MNVNQQVPTPRLTPQTVLRVIERQGKKEPKTYVATVERFIEFARLDKEVAEHNTVEMQLWWAKSKIESEHQSEIGLKREC